MNLDEYEKEHRARYADFADTVRGILEKAIAADGSAVRLQSVQCRAKSVESLKHRLEEKGLLGSQTIETDRRDLAGVRLIFYTNIDVNRFRRSDVIQQNFAIERDAVRVHHPVAENEGRRYRAVHYTVKLADDRTKLPEYARFKNMRCEIQVHTILNHAWSETGHDLIYKDRPEAGTFGGKALERIEKRYNDIIDKYLLPAGFEFEKVQHDAERLREGKELFDRDIVETLPKAQNNNERHERIASIKDHLLPNYDDIPAIVPTMRAPLVAAALAALDTPTELIKTAFGDLPGKTPHSIFNLVVDTFNRFRYADVDTTFAVLCELYVHAPDDSVRKHIQDAARDLAKYNLDVYQKAGFYIQERLVELAVGLSAARRHELAPLLTVIWGEALSSGISGTTAKADSVILRHGTVPVSESFKAIRQKALSGLFELLALADSDDEPKVILSALWRATSLPTNANYSNANLGLTLQDGTMIVDFLTGRIGEFSYWRLQDLEHDFLLRYRRARGIAEAENDRFECRDVARRLMGAIEAFRDKVNADKNFVRYKVLVGFRSVFPRSWADDSFDYGEAEKYRKQQVEAYVASINDQNAGEWFELIERCAATKSNDLATFPTFGIFLIALARQHPQIADRYLDRADASLLNFLPAFLTGLFESATRDIYDRRFKYYLDSGNHLVALARHLRNDKAARKDVLLALLQKAMAVKDDVAVIECVVIAVESWQAPQTPPRQEFFVPALRYLSERKDPRWVHGVWFFNQAKAFFADLSADETQLVLYNLLELREVDHDAQWLLAYVALAYPRLVWEFFGRRTDRENLKDDGAERYEPIPFEFGQTLQPALAQDAVFAVGIARDWFNQERGLFRYRGGRMVSNAFPGYTPELAQALGDLVAKGDGHDADFALAILQNYEGEPVIHEVLKEIVARFPDDEEKMTRVEIAIENAGVVSGEFGGVEALRERKALLEPWLADQRPAVSAYAEHLRQRMDVRIAEEQRRAEADHEMRRLEFGSDDEEDGAGE